MITKKDVDEIFEQVKRNHRLLDACPGPHEFVTIEKPGKVIGLKSRCLRCGGVVDATARLWYERGLAHGRKATP